MESSATASSNTIHHMRRELENAKEKEELAIKKILNLKKELENTKKEQSTHTTNTLHDFKKELKNAKKKESTVKKIHDLKGNSRMRRKKC